MSSCRAAPRLELNPFLRILLSLQTEELGELSAFQNKQAFLCDLARLQQLQLEAWEEAY